MKNGTIRSLPWACLLLSFFFLAGSAFSGSLAGNGAAAGLREASKGRSGPRDRRAITRILDEKRGVRPSGSRDASSSPSSPSDSASVDIDTAKPVVDRLGAFYDEDRNVTVFRLFSPRATSVVLHRYLDPDGPAVDQVVMHRLPDGTWDAAVHGDCRGTFYDFSVDGPSGPGECFDPNVTVSDPYARANVNHDGPSIVVGDDDFDWGDSDFRRLPLREVINYEMHVRDYSAHPSSSVAPELRGKYLGLLEGEGTGVVLGNLEELGVNAIELLPVHEFDNGASPTGVNHWGYMTSHYMSPECYYASGDRGQAVVELKKVIKRMHEKGIAVILDVVYNHTTEGNEDGPVLNFKGIDNKMYYRLTPDFFYWNGTGCGNEFRTEQPAVRRLVLDSLKMWMNDYHVDGFRFDLAAGIDLGTIDAISDELPKDCYLFAEPWTADWNRRMWTKGDLAGKRWSNWNDDYKKVVRAFLSSGCDRNDLMTVIAGTCFWWTSRPTESTNFLECHDNDTLDDFLGGDRRRERLGAVVMMMSQGVPMLHEGMEFARNKKGNSNSYDQDNEINWIDWGLKKKNRRYFEFWKGLIAIRRKWADRFHDRELTGNDITWYKPANGACLGYALHGSGGKDLVVLLNGDDTEWQSFELAQGVWKVLCDGERADVEGLRTASGDYRVPPLTGVVLAGPFQR